MMECRILPAFAASVAAHLRGATGVNERKSRDSGVSFDGAAPDGRRILVHEDGRVRYQFSIETRALLIQALRGSLPAPKERFSLGIDEAGTGGETDRPVLAAVLVESDYAIELLADGLRDSKAISSTQEIDRLAELIRHNAVFYRTLPLRKPSAGQGYPTIAAEAAGTLLRELESDGFFVRGLRVRIDRVDEVALHASAGATWPDMAAHVDVVSKGERYPEVAAASVLARQASLEGAKKQEGRKTKQDELFGQMFRIGGHEDGDREHILATLQNLRLAYPDIERWIGRDRDRGLWDKIQAGEYRLTVARIGNRIAGMSVTSQKDARNAKLSTFWVENRFRGLNVGPRLIQYELDRLARLRVRRAMVTFGHEQYRNLEQFFSRYGFAVDGISPQRYRDNSYEVIMGKRFNYGRITEEGFGSLVREDLFRLVGYEVEPIDDARFLAIPRNELWAVHQDSPGVRYLVQTTTSSEPETELRSVRRRANDLGALPVLAAFRGLPSDTDPPPDVLALDAWEVQNTLFPIHLERPDDRDVVVPIRPEFAQRLFSFHPQQSLRFSGLSLRSDHVYYSAQTRMKTLRRGCRIFFYVSGPGHGMVIGCAILRRTAQGTPKKLHARHGGLGAWKLDEIVGHTKGKNAMAYVFDWFQQFAQDVPLNSLKAIRPGYNPITAMAISHAQGDAIVSEGTTK